MRTPPPRAAKAAGIKTPVQSKADSHVEKVAVSKRESHVKKEAFISKKVFDAFREEVCQEFKGDREEFTRIRQLVKKRFKKMVKANEQSKLLQSINLDYNLSEKIVHHDVRITDEKLDDKNLFDSQFTIPDELLPILNAYRRESITRHPLATCEENKAMNILMIKSSNLLFKIIVRIRRPSKFNESPYTMKFGSTADAVNLTAGGQVTHLNEYINGFRMHAAVPWHIVEDIYIPVNIKEKYHWVLAILSFLERSIFLYDSYESSGHYPPVLDVIEKLAAIIPLYLQQRDFYVKKGIDVENNPTYKDKNSSDMFDVLFQKSLPQ
ncbi:hypothetical protein BC332_28075 [Capsicum chinense]|nr:hypothetical protein BC332_28075 [Capsicum chinense]